MGKEKGEQTAEIQQLSAMFSETNRGNVREKTSSVFGKVEIVDYGSIFEVRVDSSKDTRIQFEIRKSDGEVTVKPLRKSVTSESYLSGVGGANQRGSRENTYSSRESVSYTTDESIEVPFGLTDVLSTLEDKK